MSTLGKKKNVSSVQKASIKKESAGECPNCEKVRRECEEMREIIREMFGALELCLESKGLTWEVEQEADPIVRRIKQSGLLTRKPARRK
jgi:hypothetical protein